MRNAFLEYFPLKYTEQMAEKEKEKEKEGKEQTGQQVINHTRHTLYWN